MEHLQQLYEALVDLIPQEEIHNYLACGCTVGRNYDSMKKRLFVVEKFPKAEDFHIEDPSSSCQSECGCESECHSRQHHSHKNHNHHGFGSGALNSTDFTQAIGKISRHLLNIAPNQWPDSIAKTCLYKIAPIRGKASAQLMSLQRELCRQILMEELRVYRPTHILFLTGWSGVWDFDFPLQPLLKGEMVEAVGQTKDGALMLVSRYAIRDSEDGFAADIISAFQTLEETSAQNQR